MWCKLFCKYTKLKVRNEAEISASAGGFSVDFGGKCHLFSDDQNIQRRNCTASFHQELGRSYTCGITWNVPVTRHTLNVCDGPENGHSRNDVSVGAGTWPSSLRDWMQWRLLPVVATVVKSSASILGVDCTRKLAAFGGWPGSCWWLWRERSRNWWRL
jgi:hypothetical protein